MPFSSAIYCRPSLGTLFPHSVDCTPQRPAERHNGILKGIKLINIQNIFITFSVHKNANMKNVQPLKI
jgi:hypothetical protein